MRPKFSPHLSIPKAAKLAGIPYDTFKRRIERMDEELGGMLIKKFSNGPRAKGFVTLAALKRAMPEIFDDEPVLKKLDAMSNELEDLRETVTIMKKVVRDLHKRLQTSADVSMPSTLYMRARGRADAA